MSIVSLNPSYQESDEGVQSVYWSGTEVDANLASFFNFVNGGQGSGGKGSNGYGWAVRPGDSAAAVPEVGSGLLMGLGLMGMRLARRWRGR